MICPKCGEYLKEGKWCTACGARLEVDEITINGTMSDAVSDSADYGKYRSETNGKYYGAHGKKSGNGMKTALVVLCPVVIILIIFSMLLAFGVVDLNKKDNTVQSDSAEVQAKAEFDSLLKRAMNSLKIGDYDGAEDELKKLMELDPYDEEISVLCKIVFNYNKSSDALKNEDVEEARDYFDKIPFEYTEYVVSDDIENLESKIEDWEYSYDAFKKIRELMDEEKYDDAELVISLIDEDCLSESNVKKLNEYIETIERKNKEKESDKNDDEAELSLSEERAESLISTYCAAYVSAVNNGDFSLLSQYISGDLHSKQKKMVESCVKDGITMDLDYVRLNSLKKASGNEWTANVSEGETIYYKDGSVKSKEFVWTYTIEYIDGRYYLTNIE